MNDYITPRAEEALSKIISSVGATGINLTIDSGRVNLSMHMGPQKDRELFISINPTISTNLKTLKVLGTSSIDFCPKSAELIISIDSLEPNNELLTYSVT